MNTIVVQLFETFWGRALKFARCISMALYLNDGENDGGYAFPFTGNENEIGFFDPSYSDPHSLLNDNHVVDNLLLLSHGDDVIDASEGIASEGIAPEGIAYEGIASEGIASEGIAESDGNPPGQTLLDLGVDFESIPEKSSGEWDASEVSTANAANKQFNGKSPKESTGESDEHDKTQAAEEQDDFEEESLKSDDDEAAGSADTHNQIIVLTHALEEARKKKREYEEMARGYEQNAIYYEQELRRLNCAPGMLMGANPSPQTHFSAPMMISPMMVPGQRSYPMIISPLSVLQSTRQVKPMLGPQSMFPLGLAPGDQGKNTFRDGVAMLAPTVRSMANKKSYMASKERREKEGAAASKKNKDDTPKKKKK